MTREEAEVAVAIVEDQRAVRRGLELLLEDAGFRIAATADDVERAHEGILRRRPDVAIVDNALPSGSGARLAQRLAEDAPEVGVLIYTGMYDAPSLEAAIASGALGVALKAGPPEELLRAVRRVAGGMSYIDPQLRELIRGPAKRIGVLTPREREVLTLLADGLNGESIAARLVLSPDTVRTHVRNAMEKLGARTRTHAIVLALRTGEITMRSDEA